MKNFLKKFLIVFLELVIISGILWFIAEKRGIHNFGQLVPALETRIQQVIPQSFPEPSDPVVKDFSWSYKGSKYELSLTLYQSVYKFYQNEPKTYAYDGQLPNNWEEEYYGMFLKANENDQTISELVDKLKALGSKHSLNSDQIVELALAFVQAIAYDDAKAGNILAKTGNESMLYPYETLFEKHGVCSDKSLLAVSILKELGYGTAIFTYEKENHMAIGIKCPKSYSTYGSGYCYGETTSIGNKIGIIPQFDIQSKKTAEIAEIADFDQTQRQQASFQDLGQVKIYQASDGKEYAGIIEIKKIESEISQLKTRMKTLLEQISPQKETIANEITELELQKNVLEKLKDDQNFEKYNASVEKYNALLEKYKKDSKAYNENVTLYNRAVARYNVLIKQ
ncbi:MAG: hypothetical protein HGA61_04925 [Candidatus Moranbacteria bacterium]|nr:hypothetical protein [Candidatus Moranbacteria bacterium]